MKNIALLSILGLALLQPAVEAFFLGPTAVGAALGPSPLEKNSYLALSCLKEDLANKVTGKYLIDIIGNPKYTCVQTNKKLHPVQEASPL